MSRRQPAPLDDVLRVREPSPAVRVHQHARHLEVARETGNIDEAIHRFNLMLRLYHEHFQAPQMANERRTYNGFLPADGKSDEPGS